MSNKHIPALWVFLVSFVFLLPGCGPDGPNMAKVVGRITVDGEPLADATVAFAPESGQRVASALTDSTGQFELGTFTPDDGAIVGNHRITVSARGPRRPAPGFANATSSLAPTIPGLPLIPEHYFDAGTSGLTAEVKDQRKNEINFNLSSDAEAP